MVIQDYSGAVLLPIFVNSDVLLPDSLINEKMEMK